MYSKLKIFGHPIHPILVAYPIAFYTAAFVSFLFYSFNKNQYCYDFGFTCNIIGVSTAVLAAMPGFIDWAVGIPSDIPAKAKGLKHMILNVIALTLFTANILANSKDVTGANLTLALILTAIGLACTFFAGFIGGEMMQKDHVGVELTNEQQKLESLQKK
jgi:uncharacterized membrane protein